MATIPTAPPARPISSSILITAASALALSICGAWAAPTPIRRVAVPNSAAPGGGTFSGIDFSGPLTAPSGEVFFTDSSAGQTVGQPEALAKLSVTSGNVAGLSLGAGESIDPASVISVLSNPSLGQYLALVPITKTGASEKVIVRGAIGNYTKIIRTGDVLPGTPATWAPTRFSPTFYVQEDLTTTRNGDPMIKAVTADNSQAYIGLYRNGAWEATQVVGVPAPGFPAGSNFNLSALNVRAGNSAGQFVFNAQIYNGASFTQNSGAYMGQNGTLQLMMKSGDVLPGDSRQVGGSFYPGSINHSGTVAIAGSYPFGAGFVYRWSAAGGATKVISQGDPIPSIGPRAIFKAPVNFQFPMINASGAVLFIGEVEVRGDSSVTAKPALLYQSAPGAEVVKVAMQGDTIAGLPEGTVAIFDNSDTVNFNDAGQIAFVCRSRANSAALRSNGNTTILSGGTAPHIAVIAREDQPTAIDGLSGSRTFSGITRPTFGSFYSRVTGESGAILSDQGEIAFRGVVPGGLFGVSTVFQARLNQVQTSLLAEQTINFPAPFDRPASAGTLTLAATASSGLPVSYAVISGPATVTGNVLNFSGSTGDVVVRATQLGNATFLAAEIIDRTIKVNSDPNLLPPAGSALLSAVMLPGNNGPGTVYSGMDRSHPLIFGNGVINFKDAVTDDVITTATAPARLNFSAATTPGVTIPPGEILAGSSATVLGVHAANQTFITAFVTPPGISSLSNRVIASGTPGNFTKLLQTSDVLPGTTSVFGSTSIPGTVEPPFATRGGLPWVIASAPNGLSSHIGIYRNGVWENSQILGVRPPGGYAVGTKFSGPQFTAANAAGEFLFLSSVVTSTGTAAGGGCFYGKNNSLSLVAFSGTTLGGDARITSSVTSRSINSSGEAAFFGNYRQVSGNSDQGGFVYRWTATGGFSSVLKRGDFITALGANIVFDAPQRSPIINDTGGLVVLGTIFDRNPTTFALTNRRLALLYQANGTAAVEKILMTGEIVPSSPAGFGDLLAGFLSGPTFNLTRGISSIQLNNSGQIAIFSRASNMSGGYDAVHGGTLPNLSFIMKDGWSHITDAGTRLLTIKTLSNSIYDGIDGVTGDLGARLSNTGEFVFRGSYSNIGTATTDSGVFKASVVAPPIIPVAQTITFAAPVDRLVNSAAFNPGATSSSGLAVTYEIISGPATLAGNLLTPGAATGLVTIRATQAGSPSFLAAAPVERSFRLVGSASELAMSQYLATANVPPANRVAGLDLDLDGLVNLMEFALGGNPLAADIQKLPTAQVINGVLHFTYTQTQSAAVIYRVKASIDLNSLWSASAVNQGVPDLNGITTATLPFTFGSSAFLRLEVNLLP